MSERIHTHDDSACHLELPDEAATLALGAALARALTPGLVLWLEGDLGAGKTTLVRGLLRALGHVGSVKSPTYTLIEPYLVSRLNLYHFDFYRFNHPDEFLDAGLEEYFDGSGVCLVEWPDRAGGYCPRPDLRLRLQVLDQHRQAHLSGESEKGRRWLHAALTLTRAQTPPAH